MKKWLTVLLITILAVSLAACGKSESKLDTIKKNGKIVLGTSADYPPYEFHNLAGGKDEIAGFDIAIAKRVAEELGVQLEIQDMKFDGLLLALNSDKVDFVISGMTPTPERAKNVDFTNIYYTAEQGVLVKKEAVGSYQSFDDLKGKRLGVQKGTIQEGIAKEVEGAKITSLSKISELVMELASGRVDAVIAEKPVAEQYAKNRNDITVANVVVPGDEEGGSAIAVKKNNKPLVDELNRVLDELKQDGSLDQYIIEANELVSGE
ncbi:ABC transporter substrate-binding protein [Paenibacillus xylaniclasticus]|uniref:ABC transporter substrate-binding protein n=1 Tax=Paenibacillus xylaniclasticus TaxID=588083 RepID=UPI000FDA09A0|nr:MULTISPECIES: ABC transporter substrate-binding protein [Paenibacillus]GFN30112.1 amino acid ABC transporter [Paenibacillus curdlanolyticus]